MELSRRCRLGLIVVVTIGYLLMIVCFSLYKTNKEQEIIIGNQEETIAVLIGVKLSPEDEVLLKEANKQYNEVFK